MPMKVSTIYGDMIEVQQQECQEAMYTLEDWIPGCNMY